MIKSRAEIGEITFEDSDISTEAEEVLGHLGLTRRPAIREDNGDPVVVQGERHRSGGPLIPMMGTPIKDADARERSRMEQYRIIEDNYQSTRSPSEFYVAPLLEIKNCHNKMKEFYDNANNQKDCKIVTSWVLKERLYAWKYVAHTQRIQWYRVKTLSVDLLRERAEVCLIDFGINNVASFNSLFELCSEFWAWPASAYKAKLVNIIPAKGEADWSAKAIQEFKTICAPSKVFTGLIPEMCHPMTDQNSPLPLILFENAFGVRVTVQEMLVSKELADYADMHELEFEELKSAVLTSTLAHC